MAHTFQFLVTVEVDRETGKFAPRDELADKLREAIESADPSTLDCDNGGQYTVNSFDVQDYVEPKKGK
jgi:hypothetical protein